MSATPNMFESNSPIDLTGQVALVTGGGRGLGRIFARALAAAGAAVAVAARSENQLAETVSLIKAKNGQAIAVPFDVTDEPALERAEKIIQSRLGPVDLLVNNAGMWGPVNPVWETDPEQWWRTMEVHVRGSFLCARAVLPGMIARQKGRIVNVVSNAGVFRWPTASAYSVSKAALIKFTENLAVETKRQGVAVFAVHPGIATIGLTEIAMKMEDPADSHAGRAAAWIRQVVEEGRAVPPEQGAQLIVSLAAGGADMLTGRYLSVDDDLGALVARGDEINREDLYTLRLRELI